MPEVQYYLSNQGALNKENDLDEAGMVHLPALSKSNDGAGIGNIIMSAH